jgi:tRNA wybutosine-synthesizing protein 3
MPTFSARKARCLAALSAPGPDKSPKGGLDAPIAALVTWLNAHPDVCTTSSCSGRVSLFAHAPGRAKGGAWAYISHERAAEADVAAALRDTLAAAAAGAAASEGAGGVGDVVLRFEPFILTAECRTRDAGQQARCAACVRVHVAAVTRTARP